MTSPLQTRLNPNAPAWHPLRPKQPPSPSIGTWTPHYYHHHYPLISTVRSQLICYSTHPPPPKGLREKPRVARGVTREKERYFPRRKMITHGGGGRRRGGGGGSTLMIRNIPNMFNRHSILEFLDELCFNHNRLPSPSFRCEYDFLYLPMDFRRGYNLGYGFVNFTNCAAADKINKMLDGYKWGVFEDSYGFRYQSNKVCRVTRARIQGAEDLVSHFRNSKFSCHTADYLPVTLSPPRDGTTAFSLPTTVGTHIVSY